MESGQIAQRLRNLTILGFVTLVAAGGALALVLMYQRAGTLRAQRVEVIDGLKVPRLIMQTENERGVLTILGKNRQVLFAVPAPTQDEPGFEIRDFKMSRQDSSLSVDFHGRGTLIVRNPSLQDKVLLVVLREREIPASGGDANETDKFVIVSKGTGTIETYDYAFKDRTPNAKQPKYKWTLSGYIELVPGTVLTPQE